MTVGSFGTVINCIDGRVQEPVTAWLKQRYQLDYVDVITEAGPDKVLAAGPKEMLESIRRKVEISVGNHGSHLVAIVGHYDCAGNPVSRTEHVAHLEKAVDVVGGWNFDVVLLALWVNEEWEIEVVSKAAW